MLMFLELELSLGVSSLATLNHMGNDSGSLVPRASPESFVVGLQRLARSAHRLRRRCSTAGMSNQPACYWDVALEIPCLFFAPDASNNYSVRNMTALIAVLMAIKPFILLVECASSRRVCSSHFFLLLITPRGDARPLPCDARRVNTTPRRWGDTARRDLSQRLQCAADATPPLGAPAGGRSRTTALGLGYDWRRQQRWRRPYGKARWRRRTAVGRGRRWRVCRTPLHFRAAAAQAKRVRHDAGNIGAEHRAASD